MLDRALAVLAAVSFAGCAAPDASPQPPVAAAPASAFDPAEIEAVMRAQEAAWNRGDLDAFMALGYERSDALTFFSGGSVSRGYEPMLARYRKRYQSDGAAMGKLVFAKLEFVPLGDGFALARGRWDLDFAGRQPAVGGLFSLVLQRTAAGWRIVHDHTSVDG